MIFSTNNNQKRRKQQIRHSGGGCDDLTRTRNGSSVVVKSHQQQPPTRQCCGGGVIFRSLVVLGLVVVAFPFLYTIMMIQQEKQQQQSPNGSKVIPSPKTAPIWREDFVWMTKKNNNKKKKKNTTTKQSKKKLNYINYSNPSMSIRQPKTGTTLLPNSMRHDRFQSTIHNDSYLNNNTDIPRNHPVDTTSLKDDDDDDSAILSMRDLNHSIIDAYSAAWWQSIARFRTMNTTNIATQEGAVFRAIHSSSYSSSSSLSSMKDVRLTRDWFEFNVEHLSRWWKMAEFDNPSTVVPFQQLMIHLLQYLLVLEEPLHTNNNNNKKITQNHNHNGAQTIHQDMGDSASPIMAQTIGFVAYSPLGSSRSSQDVKRVRSQQLDGVVLAATIWSLVRSGMGRIVVFTDFTHLEYTQHHVWSQCRQLLQHAAAAKALDPQEHENDEDDESMTTIINTTNWQAVYQNIIKTKQHHPQEPPPKSTPPSFQREFQIFDTTIALVAIDAHVPNTWNRRNIPGRACYEMQQALSFPSSFSGTNTTTTTSEDPQWRKRRRDILGSASSTITSTKWNYIYYTEQDSLLRMRRKDVTMSRFRSNLDQGRIWIPHRMQPIPHESDFYPTHNNHPQPNNARHSSVSSLPSSSSSSYLDPPVSVFLPAVGPWQTVMKLSSSRHDYSCCDAGTESKTFLQYPPCRTNRAQMHWYLCGFYGSAGFLRRFGGGGGGGGGDTDKNVNNSKNETLFLSIHQRLSNYTLIRMTQGSGLVQFAASQHGRQCIPRLAQEGPCPRTPAR